VEGNKFREKLTLASTALAATRRTPFPKSPPDARYSPSHAHGLHRRLFWLLHCPEGRRHPMPAIPQAAPMVFTTACSGCCTSLKGMMAYDRATYTTQDKPCE
jgi:hypothetical protein